MKTPFLDIMIFQLKEYIEDAETQTNDGLMQVKKELAEYEDIKSLLAQKQEKTYRTGVLHGTEYIPVPITDKDLDEMTKNYLNQEER